MLHLYLLPLSLLPLSLHTLSFVCPWLETAEISAQINVHTKRVLSNQQNSLELFQIIPFLKFPILFVCFLTCFVFIDSQSWNWMFGHGAYRFNHSSRREEVQGYPETIIPLNGEKKR